MNRKSLFLLSFLLSSSFQPLGASCDPPGSAMAASKVTIAAIHHKNRDHVRCLNPNAKASCRAIDVQHSGFTRGFCEDFHRSDPKSFPNCPGRRRSPDHKGFHPLTGGMSKRHPWTAVRRRRTPEGEAPCRFESTGLSAYSFVLSFR